MVVQVRAFLAAALIALATAAQSATPGISITDGSTTVSNATHLSVSGGTVGGTTPNATLTVSGGGSGVVSSCAASGALAYYASTGTTVGCATTGTGVLTALGVNVGSAGSPVVNGGVLGTPSSGTLTNATGLPISTGVSGLGTGVSSALGITANTTGGVVTYPGGTNTPGFISPANVSGLNTTGLGICSASSSTLTIANALNFTNGMSIAIPGAGTAGATLITTVSGSPTTTTITLATPCVTAVNFGFSATGSTTSGSRTVGTGSTIAGVANGAELYVYGAGAGGGVLVGTIASGAGTSTLVLASSGPTASATIGSGAIVITRQPPVYTIGTIGSSSTSLAVVTTAGWVVNQGIDVAGAGGGGADLVTYVTAIPDGTHLTLHDASTGAVTNAKINHDDSAAIIAALATGSNVELGAGQFNVTSALNLAYPQWLKCAGAGVGLTAGYSNNAAPIGGTIIWNRGKTNNVINISSQQAHLSDCGIVQAADIIPTAGFCIVVGSGTVSTLLNGGWIERNKCYNEYQQLDMNQGLVNWKIMFNDFAAGEFMGNAAQEIYNNTEPAGDSVITGNNFAEQVANTAIGLSIPDGDTTFWMNNKWTGCSVCLSITGSSVDNQQFIGNGFENFTTDGVAISAGSAYLFTGTEMELNGSSGYGFHISGSASNGVITVTNMATATGGSTNYYSNTSSGSASWTHTANVPSF